jgi:SAM-dependent methyltransferase
MNNIEQLVESAYHHFSRQEYMAAYDKFLQLEQLLGEQAHLSNEMAVTLFQSGLMDQAIARFKHAASLEESSLVTDNLINVAELQWRELDGLRKALQNVQNELSKMESDAVKNSRLQIMYERISRMRLKDARQEWFENSAVALHERALGISDVAWFRAIIDSTERETIEGFLLPGFVSDVDQINSDGSAGRAALIEGANFVKVVLEYSRRYEIPLGESDFRVCDFGSGWGRHTRFMLKYAHPDNIFGVDFNGQVLEKARKNFGMCNFIKLDNFPPCPFRDNFFDLVFGYSVFSHLSRECADAWVSEFSRIVRPGGLVIMTTHGRDFIEFCRQVRESGDRPNRWFECFAQYFVDADDAYKQYDDGLFVHAAATGVAGCSASMISRGYIEKNWFQYFDLVDFVDDRSFLPKALFVLRRKNK